MILEIPHPGLMDVMNKQEKKLKFQNEIDRKIHLPVFIECSETSVHN